MLRFLFIFSVFAQPAFAQGTELRLADVLRTATQAPLYVGARTAAEALEPARGTFGQTTLTLQPGIRTAPEPDRGLEAQVTVTHSIPLTPVRRSLRDAERIGRTLADARARALLWAEQVDRAELFLDLQRSSSLFEIRAEAVTLAQRALALVTHASTRGVATIDERARAEADLAEAQLLLHRARFEQRAACALLSARIEASETCVRIAAEPIRSEPLEVDEGEWVTTHPALVEARLAADDQRHRAGYVRAATGPTLSLGGQLQWDSPSGFVPFALIQVQGANRLARSHSESVSRSEAMLLDSQTDDLERGLRESLLRLQMDRALLASEEEELLAQHLDALVEALTARRERGEATFFEVFEAYRRRNTVRVERDETFFRALRAQVLLEIWNSNRMER